MHTDRISAAAIFTLKRSAAHIESRFEMCLIILRDEPSEDPGAVFNGPLEIIFSAAPVAVERVTGEAREARWLWGVWKAGRWERRIWLNAAEEAEDGEKLGEHSRK